MTKLERALAIRDAVLPWLRVHGRLVSIPCRGRAPVSLFCGTIAGFAVTYRTPFSNMPLLPTPRNYAEARFLAGVAAPLPYELDIRGGGNRRLVIEWAEDGRVNLRYFNGIKQGWDVEFLHAIDIETATDSKH